MAIDYHKLENQPFRDVVQSHTAKNCILHALAT